MATGSLRTTLLLAMTTLALALVGEWLLAVVHGENEVRCDEASVPVALPALPEASGMVASRKNAGLLWLINDSSPAILFGVTDTGDVKARVQVDGAMVKDPEDLSIGKCPTGTCLYIADIGDNDEQRSTIRLYRIPEPGLHDRGVGAVELFEARYPDRPHDAEATFITADGTAYLVTKETLGGELYRFPALQSGKPLVLERIGVVPMAKITDADTSADGAWVGVRSPEEVLFFRAADVLKGDLEHGAAVTLRGFDEPQGEAIAFGTRDTLFLAGEGGRKGVPGTLLQMRCVLPSAS